MDVESLPGLLVAGVHGEEEQLVLPEAGSKGSEQPWGLLLVSEQHQLSLTHCAAKSAVDVAAADAHHNVWEGGHGKGMQVFGCPVACSDVRQLRKLLLAALFKDCSGFLNM